MNKVISREYVEKNYIHKDVIRRELEILKDAENNLNKGIGNWHPDEITDLYAKITILEKILEETKDVNK